MLVVLVVVLFEEERARYAALPAIIRIITITTAAIALPIAKVC